MVGAFSLSLCWRRSFQVLGLAGVLGVGAACAQPLTQSLPSNPAEMQACVADNSQALDTTTAQLAQCLGNAAWLAWVGDRLNRADRSAEAAEYLERALLLDPDLLPAQLGYLLALAGSGEAVAAVAFAQDLLQRQALPAAMADAVSQRIKRWQDLVKAGSGSASAGEGVAAGKQGWTLRPSVGLRLGHDSNLLSAPNIDSLALTIAGSSIQLPLDPATYRSRRGSYLREDGSITATRPLDAIAPGLRLDVNALAWRREGLSVPNSRIVQAHLVAEVSQRLADWGWYAGTALAELNSVSGTHYATRNGSLGFSQRADLCEARVGAELQQREMRSAPVLSGTYRGLAASLYCEPRATALAAQSLWWYASAALGTDRASDPSRPGGNQSQAVVRLNAGYGSLKINAEIERRHDALAYSELFGGMVRHTTRRTVRAEWRGDWSGLGVSTEGAATGTPVTWSLRYHIGLEWNLQRSNFSLFGFRSWGPYASFSYIW